MRRCTPKGKAETFKLQRRVHHLIIVLYNMRWQRQKTADNQGGNTIMERWLAFCFSAGCTSQKVKNRERGGVCVICYASTHYFISSRCGLIHTRSFLRAFSLSPALFPPPLSLSGAAAIFSCCKWWRLPWKVMKNTMPRVWYQPKMAGRRAEKKRSNNDYTRHISSNTFVEFIIVIFVARSAPGIEKLYHISAAAFCNQMCWSCSHSERNRDSLFSMIHLQMRWIAECRDHFSEASFDASSSQ